MVTNNYDFKTITRLRMLCMKVLPTVYGDALSYEEQVCKVTEKINQLVDTVNELPDYIIEVVKELIENAGLENIVKQVLADMFFINVKNPPAPYVAAKGDGTTNDTAAIQALINYAAEQHTYLFFPKGTYLVNGLVMSDYTSLVGLDRYNTIIMLAPNSNKNLITGFVENCTVTGLTFNANMNAQSSNCSCLGATVENALIGDVIFKNGYDSVVIDNTGNFQGLEWLFDGIQHNALTINGDGAQIDNVQFVNVSQLGGNSLINVNGENIINGIASLEAIPKGVVLTTTGSNVTGIIKNATTPVTGGEGNNINIYTEKGEIVWGTSKTASYNGNVSENASDYSTTVQNKIETIAVNKTVNVGGNIGETIKGGKTETITGSKKTTANEIVVSPTLPIEYQKGETVVNEYFNGLPIKDNDRDTFLLVPGAGNIKDDINSVKNMPYFGYFFTPYCTTVEYYPQGTCLIDDNTMVCFYSDNTGTNTAVLQKIDMRTGAILLSKTVTNAYHGNSLTYVPESNEIFTVRYYDNGTTGGSNQIIVFNADTLTISRSFVIAGVDTIACLNYQKGKLYLSDRATFVTFYSCNLDGTELTKLFTSTFSTTWLSYTDMNLNVWYTNGFNMLVCSDLTGVVIGTYNIDFYSADYSTFHTEMESFMELSDGTLLFTDIGYKRSAEGLWRRHVVNSFKKSIVNGQPINWNIRGISIMPALAVRNKYNTFQNGYDTDNAYDSIEYATKIASAVPGSVVTIDGNNEVFNEWVVVRSDRIIFLNHMTIQGMVVDYSTVSTSQGLTIKAGCADKVAAYVNVNRPTCLALWRWSKFITNTGTVDGENVEGVNGVYQGYMCLGRFTGSRIINCAIPIYGQWSEPSTFGGYTIDFIGDIISNQYNMEQYGSQLLTRFGGAYGRKTKTLTGINFGNWTTQKFNAKNFMGQMVSMVVNNNTYTFDLTAGTRCLLYCLDGTTPAYIQFTATVTNAEDGATFNITNVATVPASLDKTKYPITKIALW